MKKVLLTIIDGFGISYESDGNAIKYSRMDNYNKLVDKYPNVRLEASGRKVGLQKGIAGNSEIGHMSIGAGRIIKQNMMQMEDLFDYENLSNNKTYNKMIDYINTNEKALHIVALLSDSGIHSHIKFILKMLDILHESNIVKVYFHAILDGKDTNTKAIDFLTQVNDKLRFHKMGTIATICGRMYAMDKNKDYDKTKVYYDLIAKGEGNYTNNLSNTINELYNEGNTDYDMPPIILDRKGIIKDNDVIVSLNYRKDSIIQILEMLSNSNNNLEKSIFNDLKIYTIYNIKEIKNNNYFLDNTRIDSPIGVYLASLGLSQARIADVSKYVYVNYYFDGCHDLKLENCDRFLIQKKDEKDPVKAMDMTSIDLTKQTIKCMDNDYDFIVVNYSTPDLLANKNDFEGTKRALEVVDYCLGKLYEYAQDNFYTMFILSDHGNCEDFLKLGNTLNPVPLIVTDDKVNLTNGCLTNVAPTILKYMDISLPKEMQETEDLFVK